jgi:hypothetical protein
MTTKTPLKIHYLNPTARLVPARVLRTEAQRGGIVRIKLKE